MMGYGLLLRNPCSTRSPELRPRRSPCQRLCCQFYNRPRCHWHASASASFKFWVALPGALAADACQWQHGLRCRGHWPEADPLPVLAHAVLHRQIQEPRDQRPWSGILRVAFSYRVPSGQAVCSAVHH